MWHILLLQKQINMKASKVISLIWLMLVVVTSVSAQEPRYKTWKSPGKITAETEVSRPSSRYTPAQETYVDGLKYRLNQDNSATVLKCDTALVKGDLVIPGSITVDGTTYKVNSIFFAAFSNCTTLTSVVIPDGITRIPNETFSGCSNLRRVSLSDSVVFVGNGAFSGCGCLTDTIDGVIYMNDILIGFDRNNPDSFNKSDYSVREGTRIIAGHAFVTNTVLKSIIIPEGVVTIGAWAFNACHNLRRVVLPESLKNIDSYAFRLCLELESINIPSELSFIGESAFEECGKIRNLSVIPYGVTSIENAAFSNNAGLTQIIIPKGVKKIGWRSFEQCVNLKSVIIPEGVTSIGRWCFSGCCSLESIVIPASVTEIDEDAFFNCINLKNVNMPEGAMKEKLLEYLSIFQDEEKHGVSDGHEWVDLGLSVKWATCNVGASIPGQSGGFYHKDYQGDVAHNEWGGSWRLPTVDEWYELMDNCMWTVSAQDGVRGFKIISMVNRNSIFLPYTGLETVGSRVALPGQTARYKTSTPDTDCVDMTFQVNCTSSLWDWGLSVRPVQ